MITNIGILFAITPYLVSDMDHLLEVLSLFFVAYNQTKGQGVQPNN
jgi:hypothetical protein